MCGGGIEGEVGIVEVRMGGWDAGLFLYIQCRITNHF